MVLEAPKLDVPKELNVAQDVSFKNSSSDKTKEEMETVKGKEEIESAKNATEDFKNAIQQQDWTYALSILLRPKVNI